MVYETNEGKFGRLAVQNRCFFVFTYRWHGVAVWKWDVNEDVCGICRLAFDACCPDCTVPGDNCSPGENPWPEHCSTRFVPAQNGVQVFMVVPPGTACPQTMMLLVSPGSRMHCYTTAV